MIFRSHSQLETDDYHHAHNGPRHFPFALVRHAAWKQDQTSYWSPRHKEQQHHPRWVMCQRQHYGESVTISDCCLILICESADELLLLQLTNQKSFSRRRDVIFTHCGVNYIPRIDAFLLLFVHFFQSSFDNVVTAEGNFISKHELLLLFYR